MPCCLFATDVFSQADVYSLGVTLWEAVERQRPWQGLDGMQLWTMWVADPDSVTLPPLMVDPAAGEGGA
jgi:serine/threonine protein kinase